MKTIKTDLLLRLTQAALNGKIREEHLEAFLERPDAVLKREWDEKFIGLMPKSDNIGAYSLRGNSVFCSEAGKGLGLRYLFGNFVSDWYADLRGASIVHGKLHYLAQQEGRWTLMCDARVVRDLGFSTHGPRLCSDGHNVACAYQSGGDEPHTILLNGEDVCKVSGLEHFSLVDGKLLYASTKEGRSVISYGGVTGRSFDTIATEPTVIDGRPMYIALSNATPDAYLLVHGDDVRSFALPRELCQKIVRFVMWRGLPLVVLEYDAGSVESLLYHGEKLHAKCEGTPCWISIANDKPLYDGMGEMEFYVHGEEIVEVPGELEDLMSVKGIPVCKVMANTRHDEAYWEMVMLGGAESRRYDAVFSLAVDEERGEVSFGAIRGRKAFRVTRRVL